MQFDWLQLEFVAPSTTLLLDWFYSAKSSCALSWLAKSEYNVPEYGGRKSAAVALEPRWSYWKQTEALMAADNRLNIWERDERATRLGDFDSNSWRVSWVDARCIVSV